MFNFTVNTDMRGQNGLQNLLLKTKINFTVECIDHSHIVLIYRRSERVGPFTRICRPDRTGNESCPGRNCQQMQMYGTRVKENFRKYSLSERVSC